MTGIFAGVFPSSTVFVRNASQLSGTLDSTKVYLIDGVVDMGAVQIIVPQSGLSIHGLGFNISGLTTSQINHTLFIDDGVFSGDLTLRDLFVTVSGTGSQVFDLDNAENNNAVELKNFNFVDCLSLGVLDSYRQGLWDNFATIRCVDGLTLEGNWSGGFAALTTIIVSAGVSFTGTLLKKGAALVVGGSIRSDMNALQIDATGTVCDFAPANITNDAGFLMSGVRVNPASIAFPNMPESSVKAIFTNCTGTDDTHIGGQWSITTAIATTISTINTPVKLAGTTTYVDLQHMTGAASNAMTYIATDKIAVAVSGVLPLAGTSNDVINAKLRLWDNSASGYVEISQSGGVTMNAGGRAEGVSIEGITDMDTNDRVEIWVENQTGGRNVTADLGGLVHISKRT